MSTRILVCVRFSIRYVVFSGRIGRVFYIWILFHYQRHWKCPTRPYFSDLVKRPDLSCARNTLCFLFQDSFDYL